MPSKGSSATKVRVLLADDQPEVVTQVTRILGDHFDIIGAVADGLALLEAARRLKPDMILLDVTMPGLDGFGVARSLKRAGCRSYLAFLTVHEDADYAREAMALGAGAYVVKSRLASDLLIAIREAVAGRKFISPTVKT